MILFNNLHPLRLALADEIAAATTRVLESGWYILGPEVENFERAFAEYHGRRFSVSVANGTDAIELGLRAAGIGPGDEVITVAHTAVATVVAVERSGATPVLVDICPRTFTIDPAAVAAAITPRTKAIVPVHLYGRPADMTALAALAARHDLLLLEDCAQAHGARHRNRLVGTIGHLGAYSFYPTKNLGAYGDGGAIVTDDADLAARLKRLRFYGQAQRYQSQERGMNSRLDEMQAAILSVKLKYLDQHNDARRKLAAQYRTRLASHAPALPPQDDADIRQVYHLFVLRHARRDALRASLTAAGVDSQIHYPVPVHRQPAYADLNMGVGSLPETERAAAEVLSLPLYVGLSAADVDRVADAVNSCWGVAYERAA